MNTDKVLAIETARKIIAERPVYLDTETTGLDSSAEIVDIAVIDHDGTELMNTLIRPALPIPEQATSVHGIKYEDVASAPYLPICTGPPLMQIYAGLSLKQWQLHRCRVRPNDRAKGKTNEGTI